MGCEEPLSGQETAISYDAFNWGETSNHLNTDADSSYDEEAHGSGIYGSSVLYDDELQRFWDGLAPRSDVSGYSTADLPEPGLAATSPSTISGNTVRAPFNATVDGSDLHAVIQDARNVRSNYSQGFFLDNEHIVGSTSTGASYHTTSLTLPSNLPTTTYTSWPEQSFRYLFSSTSQGTSELLSTLSSGSSPPLPSTPSTSTFGTGRFFCRYCGKASDKSNDHKRHEDTHTSNGPHFVCRCGYRNKRKDNYRRHVRSCRKSEIYDVYTCKCEHLLPDKDIHLDHIACCTVGHYGNAGRPAVNRP